MGSNILSRRDFLSASAVGAASFVALPLSRASSTPALKSTRSHLTMLNSTAGPDFELAVQRHLDLGLRWLDLRDAIWGQRIDSITADSAKRVADIALSHRLGVACLSTSLCASNLEEGESAFRSQHFATLEHVLQVAEILKPQFIRLLSASVRPFPKDEPVMTYLERRHPWTFDAYREMVDRIVSRGYHCLIENEVVDVILGQVPSVLRFFERLGRPGRAYFTWDVQNFWQSGVFPTLDVYRQLKPVIGCVHLKGGRSEDGRTLAVASSLEDASWPVADIVRAVVTDGVAPFICLNSSHGRRPSGYNDWNIVQRDVAFLRERVSSDL